MANFDNTIDIELLISLVFERGALWDRRSKEYSNRYITGKEWKEIATIMKVEETKLRKKWKYLRDQFATEYSKIFTPKSGDKVNEMDTPKWPHYKLLYFLKDIIKPRSSIKYLNIRSDESLDPVSPQNSGPCEKAVDFQSPSPSLQSVNNEHDLSIPYDYDNDDDDDDDENNDEVQENDDVHSTSQSNETMITNSTFRSNSQSMRNRKRAPMKSNRIIGDVKKKAKRTVKEAILEIEQQKIQIMNEKMRRQEFERNVEDDDLYFLKSLLPHIKRIPDHRKLSFRCRIQEVVERFAYPSTSDHAESLSYSLNVDCNNQVYTPTTMAFSNNNDDIQITNVLPIKDENTDANTAQYGDS